MCSLTPIPREAPVPGAALLHGTALGTDPEGGAEVAAEPRGAGLPERGDPGLLAVCHASPVRRGAPAQDLQSGW